MPILNFQTTFIGETGILPSRVAILTNDPEATVLTAGYLNKIVQNGASFPLPCLAEVSTKATLTSDYRVGWYQIVHSGGNWSLTAAGSPGDVVLPTIANHIAVFTNTTGQIGEDAATAINGGNIQAGLSGTAGTLISFPSTASKGALIVAGVANTGNTNTTLSNVAMGQASVVSIPDPANAIGHLLIGATATPFTTGNFPQNSGAAGLMIDSGIAVSNIQQKTQVKAVLSANIGGAGAGPLTVNVTNMTTASVVVVTVSSSSNACYVVKATPGTGSFALTVNTDPGASLIINYIAYIAAQ